jgi:hypothetical protein
LCDISADREADLVASGGTMVGLCDSVLPHVGLFLWGIVDRDTVGFFVFIGDMVVAAGFGMSRVVGVDADGIAVWVGGDFATDGTGVVGFYGGLVFVGASSGIFDVVPADGDVGDWVCCNDFAGDGA